jgi:hypothetical protein
VSRRNRADELPTVTFGAIADLPPRLRRVHRFSGEMNQVSGMNSRLQMLHTRFSNARHQHNTAHSFRDPVQNVLKPHVEIG